MMERFLRKSGFIAMFVFISMILWTPSSVFAALIKAEEIKAMIANHAEKNMPWPPGTMRLDFTTKIADAVVAGDKVTIEVLNRPEEDFIGDSAFTVKFFSRGTPIKEQTVRVRMEVLRDVVVAAGALAKDREVKAGDIRVLKKWVRRPPADFIKTPEEVLGKFLTVNMRPNTEITRNVVKAPLLVKKGKLVRVVLDNDCVSVTTVGISEENGALGVMIRVKNISSHRTIYARVAGDSLVQVEL